MAALVRCAAPRVQVAPQSAQQQDRRTAERRFVRAQSQGSDPDGHGSGASPPTPQLPAASSSRPTASQRPAAAQLPPIPLSDPAGVVVYGSRLPPARRLIVSGLSATAIALGGNMFGITSCLLSLDGGQLAARSNLDVLVPVNGSRRCLDVQNGFTFLYPAHWLADQTLYRRYAERVEREAALDPPSLSRARARRQGAPEPVAAFGPPSSTGEENMSVVVAPIRPDFTLANMGSPEEAATRFLQEIVAPEGSGRTAALVGAGSRRDAGGELYYFQEFTVQTERFFRHNLSVLAARNGLLYTLNCQSSEVEWAANEAGFRKAADSFAILDSGAASASFLDRL